MARLFITLYAGIIVSFYVFLFSVEIIATSLSYDVGAQDSRNTLMGYVALLSRVKAAAGEQAMQEAMHEVANLNAMLASEVTDPVVLNHPKIKALPSPGGMVDQIDLEEHEPAYFRLAEDTRVFRVIDDPDAELWAKERLLNTLAQWGLLLVMGLIVGVWFFYLHRKLKRLELASGRIAAGDFSARVGEDGGSRVGGLNRAFNGMAERVEQLIASHKRLTNAVAHELRTPIFRLRCQLELLEHGCAKEEHDQFVEGMEADLEELETMVDELLTFARMERADLDVNLVSTDLDHWLNQQLPMLIRSSDLPLSLNIDQPVSAMVDSKLLQRAITNLVRNADKYGREQVRICLLQTADIAQICVDDDGPGIPPSERERVLEPFERLDSARTRKTGGYGLGLTIVREIVAYHRGSVLIEDAPLGGARIIINLPRSV
ncbi:HAMP domain-containing protein [Pontibacterium sp. N1Y112]|uniref:histidine kinase n=1 Tax=Pontibacterium sinense TaxID=2781979 RepID=A0A8J7K6R9_9GAMM|nr:ATP-binding protein [Pontibacterium sinense]MBE9397346.1 HAMP domain-containing protein [Pontibacterium sinense]